MLRQGGNIYKRKDNRRESRYFTTDPEKKYKSIYAKSYSAVKEKNGYLIKCKVKIQIARLTSLTMELSVILYLSCGKLLQIKES